MIQPGEYVLPIVFIHDVYIHTPAMQIVADSEGIFGLGEEVKADKGVYLECTFTR